MEDVTTKKAVPQYRSIKAAVRALRAEDDQSAVSEFLVRKLCKSNQVQYICSGNKSLVNLSDLKKLLGFPDCV